MYLALQGLREELQDRGAITSSMINECDEPILLLFRWFSWPYHTAVIKLQIEDHGCRTTSPVCRSVSELVPFHSRRISVAACGCPGAEYRVPDPSHLSVTTFW